jgi:hypothetical protein
VTNRSSHHAKIFKRISKTTWTDTTALEGGQMRIGKGGTAKRSYSSALLFAKIRQIFEQEIGPWTRSTLYITTLTFLYRFGDFCVFHTRYLSRRFEVRQKKTRIQTSETATLTAALRRFNKTWSFILTEGHSQFVRERCWGEKSGQRKRKWIKQ